MATTMTRMAGKVVIVTGATGGIGSATALRLGQEGAKLVLVARNHEKATTLLAEVRARGGDGHVVLADVSKDEENAKIVKEAIDKFGQIDAAFLAAGILKMTPLAAATQEDLTSLTNVNMGSVMFGLKHLIPAMKEKGGSIVVVASVTASAVNVNSGPNSLYSASKAAVLMLAKYGAIEGAPAVRVNSISPGITDTGMTQPFGGAQVAAKVHLNQRAGKPEEIAGLVAYLVSDEASFITGSDYVIDGGEALVL